MSNMRQVKLTGKMWDNIAGLEVGKVVQAKLDSYGDFMIRADGRTYRASSRSVATLVEAGYGVEVCKTQLPGGSMVKAPAHYQMLKDATGLEVMDILDILYPGDPDMWQVGKYIMRAKHKGNEVQDLEKAQTYLQRRIDKLKSA